MEELPQQSQPELAPDKAVVLENPVAPDAKAMSRQEALAKRNALVKELFRIAPATHPPKMRPSASDKPKSSTVLAQHEDAPEDREGSIKTLRGVHLDLYDYFDMNVNTVSPKNLERLQRINSWVQSQKDGLRKLYEMDLKFGSSDSGEAKLVKLYNWLRFSKG